MKAVDLKKKLEAGEPLVLLDVREREEAAAHAATIPGAENMPMGKVFLEAAQGTLPKDRKIVTICAKGGRCEIVARELQGKGYDIEALEGGLDAWNDSEAA